MEPRYNDPFNEPCDRDPEGIIHVEVFLLLLYTPPYCSDRKVGVCMELQGGGSLNVCVCRYVHIHTHVIMVRLYAW